MPHPVLIFAGVQASGKGTQARIYAEKHGFVIFESGKTFRDEIAAQSPLGKQIKNYLDSGTIVPNELIRDLIVERLVPRLGKDKLILDGFPRTLAQDDDLRAWCGTANASLKLVHIMITEQEAIKRIAGRRECNKCGAKYGTIHGAITACEKCGSMLTVRDDETPEAVQKRLRSYREQTYPIVERYLSKGQGIEINGAQSVEAVANAVRESLGHDLS